MPIYEYECAKCGQTEEVFQKFGEEPLKKCSCGGKMRKLVSASAFHLKGSGWYVTDYGRGKGGSCAKTEKKDGGKPAEKCETAKTGAGCASCASKKSDD